MPRLTAWWNECRRCPTCKVKRDGQVSRLEDRDLPTQEIWQCSVCGEHDPPLKQIPVLPAPRLHLHRTTKAMVCDH